MDASAEAALRKLRWQLVIAGHALRLLSRRAYTTPRCMIKKRPTRVLPKDAFSGADDILHELYAPRAGQKPPLREPHFSMSPPSDERHAAAGHYRQPSLKCIFSALMTDFAHGAPLLLDGRQLGCIKADAAVCRRHGRFYSQQRSGRAARLVSHFSNRCPPPCLFDAASLDDDSVIMHEY